MTDIKDYTVVVGHDRLTNLEEEVKSYINKGWEPIGSITIEELHSIGDTNYLQPMIKRENKNDR